jgi:allantoate deiminase
MLAVEAYARGVQGLVATTGRVTAEPGAVNVVAGAARVTLDVRHAKDAIRNEAVKAMVAAAQRVASERGGRAEWAGDERDGRGRSGAGDGERRGS